MGASESLYNESFSFSEGDMVRSILEGEFIIGYGTINSIPADGVVCVVVSVAKGLDGMCSVVCPYASTLMSSSLALDIKPKVKDKVLLLSPQFFKNEMFSKEQYEPIVAPEAFGYSPLACVAVPMTQYREGEYKNLVTVDDGTINAKLAYDADEDANQAELTIDAKGKLEYKNPKVTVTVSDDGSFTVENEKTTVTIGSDGNLEIETDGKFTFKNNTTDLKTVLSDLATEIKNLQTYGSPATHTVTPTSQTSITAWETSELDALLE